MTTTKDDVTTVDKYELLLQDTRGLSKEVADSVREFQNIQNAAQVLVDQFSLFPDPEQAAVVLAIAAMTIATVITDYISSPEFALEKLSEVSFSMSTASDKLLNG